MVVLSQLENNFVEQNVLKNKVQFLRKRKDGVFAFKRLNEATLNFEYSYYIEGICCLCKKPHFKRRNNKDSDSHHSCELLVTRNKKIKVAL